jgi:hypothetical protein
MDLRPRIIVVTRRFCGPPASANGGYVCGLIAQLAQRPVTVRLLAPPPLDTNLEVAERDGLLEVSHDGNMVAQARPGDVDDLVPPPPPSHDEAVEASRHYAGFERHPAPTCFVCGPRRAEPDGLSIFPGPVGTDGMVAAPWIPDATLAGGGDDGSVGSQFIWAALDCPGYIAVAPDMRQMLLGELTARIDRGVRVGERCVVIGWSLGSSGRKHEAGTALFGEHGELCARARALWIEPRTQPDGV